MSRSRLLLSGFILGCSSSTQPADGGTSSDSAVLDSSPMDGAMDGIFISDAGMDAPCNALDLNKVPVPAFSESSGSPPAPMGGQVALGTYYAMKVTTYSGVDKGPIAGPQWVLVLKNSAQMDWADSVMVERHFAGLWVAADAGFSLQITCPPTSTGATNPYTATSQSLVLFTKDGKNQTQMIEFAKQ